MFNDVAAVWRRLESDGYLIGIASNFDERLPLVCRAHPPLDTCRHLFYSAELGYGKPHRMFFTGIQQRLNLSPKQILLIGNDEVCDLAGAQNAGWQALLVDREANSKANDTIRTLADLPAMLANQVV